MALRGDADDLDFADDVALARLMRIVALVSRSPVIVSDGVLSDPPDRAAGFEQGGRGVAMMPRWKHLGKSS